MLLWILVLLFLLILLLLLYLLVLMMLRGDRRINSAVALQPSDDGRIRGRRARG